MTRVAAIDLGTNSTRLLVADVADERIDELERVVRITGLGEGVDRGRRLLPGAIARVHACLADYRRIAADLDATKLVATATSAVRDAENWAEFLREIAAIFDLETRLLSGDDEALLTFRGVSTGRGIAPGTLVVDIGGGSTELILGGPTGVDFHASLDIGCVRLTERHGEDVEACAADVRRQLPTLDVSSGIGVAGTVTTLAALDLGLVTYDPERVHGHRLSLASIRGQLERLAALSLEQRRRLPGLEPSRAPVIVAGSTILREVVEHYGLTEIEASERDLLDGAALAAAA